MRADVDDSSAAESVELDSFVVLGLGVELLETEVRVNGLDEYVLLLLALVRRKEEVHHQIIEDICRHCIEYLVLEMLRLLP